MKLRDFIKQEKNRLEGFERLWKTQSQDHVFGYPLEQTSEQWTKDLANYTLADDP
jgi:hypothetical protein